MARHAPARSLIPPTGNDAGSADAARTLLEALPRIAEGGRREEDLRRHGLLLRHALLADAEASSRLTGQLAADRPPAEMLAVRRFALGWVADERETIDGDGAEDAAFEAALKGLIRGLVPGAVERPRRLHRRLWTLLTVARESADIVYSRVAGLPELDRRILILLDDRGALVLKDITRLMGADKAQISRSVKRLGELGLAERGTVRQPLVLTATGHALTSRLRRMFEVRSHETALGIEPRALEAFFDVLDIVTRHAIVSFERERMLAGSGERATAAGSADDLKGAGRQRRSEAVVARLITLLSYIQRGSALAYKRMTGLSNFEAFVMIEVAREPPIEWTQLTTALARDESQAARTVRRLADRGLIEHHGAPGRRQGMLQPTVEGVRVFHILEAESWRRDELLVEGVASDMLASFLASLDRMTWNVQAQLVRDLAAQASGAARQ